MEESEFESLRIMHRFYGDPERLIEIVDLLEEYNKPAILYIEAQRRIMSMKQAYRSLQRTPLWKKPRKLLKEYYTDIDGLLRCKHCRKVLTKSYTMHHNMYNPLCIVHPLYIDIICGSCHKKCHPEAKR
jgi:hypothetical protein